MNIFVLLMLRAKQSNLAYVVKHTSDGGIQLRGACHPRAIGECPDLGIEKNEAHAMRFGTAQYAITLIA